MQKSKIEWTDFSINPVKGLCPVDCKNNQGKSYCYARRMYKRFRWNSEIRFDISVFDECAKIEPCESDPQRIFVGSTMELFGDWVKDDWMEQIFLLTSDYPDHRFIFLTKQPQNLIKWSPFPDNCWVGVSTTGFDCRSNLEDVFKNIHAKVKFVSIEPLLDYSPMDFRWVDWVIIGQQTPVSIKTQPRYEWLKGIVESASREKKTVFLKNNLWRLLYTQLWDDDIFWVKGNLRQEFPIK